MGLPMESCHRQRHYIHSDQFGFGRKAVSLMVLDQVLPLLFFTLEFTTTTVSLGKCTSLPATVRVYRSLAAGRNAGKYL